MQTNKIQSISFSTLIFVLSIFLIFGCDLLNKNDAPQQTNDQIIRDAYQTIVEANAAKQVVLYDIVEAYSNGYQAGQLFSYDPSYKEIDSLMTKISALNEFDEKIGKALIVLNGAEQTLKTDVINGWGGYMSDSEERNRNRIILITSQMTANEKSKLYNALRTAWKTQTTSESDFWTKLAGGIFDAVAGQMYNDFYHEVETEFKDIAKTLDLTPTKVIVREMAEGIKKGADLLVETTKAEALLGKGIDLAAKGKMYVLNLAKSLNSSDENIKDAVKNKIATKVGNYQDVDGAIQGTKLGEETGIAIKILLDAYAGSENPSEWVKNSTGWGATKIIDSDTTASKADIVFTNKMDIDNTSPQIIIGVGESDDEQGGVNIALPTGKWDFTVMDNVGNKDQVITEVVEKVYTILLASTDPNDRQQDSQYSLSVWVSPADPAAGEAVNVYAKIYPNDADVEIYFSIVGSDGYSKEETNKTNDDGEASFYIPGGSSDTKDDITVTIVSSGLTRTLSYVF